MGNLCCSALWQSVYDDGAVPHYKPLSQIHPTESFDSAFEAHPRYFTNDLAIPSSSSLWYYDDRYRYDQWDCFSAISPKKFTQAYQQKNVRMIEEILKRADSEPKQEVNQDSSVSKISHSLGSLMESTSKHFKKKFKLQAYNRLLQELELTHSNEATEVQGELSDKMNEFIHILRDENLMNMQNIYRASTNAWPMFTLQYLLDGVMEVNTSVIGFSALYPLTDDIYDDQSLTKEQKLSFGQRFSKRIDGSKHEDVYNDREAASWKMIDYIERIVDRQLYPLPYQAMGKLNDAQIASIAQIQPTIDEEALHSEKFARKIWKLTVWKGISPPSSPCSLTRHTRPTSHSFFLSPPMNR